MWGALFNERTDLSFTISIDPRQRSHSRVRVPHILLSQIRDSRNRLAKLYPQALDSLFATPTTDRATVEVFEPSSTRGV
jgi:hypothetical protein